MPLKKISNLLSPQLLHTLASMGCGDEIVLVDGYLPTSDICGPIKIRAHGDDMEELLAAILDLLPLHDSGEDPRPVHLEILAKEDVRWYRIKEAYLPIIESKHGRPITFGYVPTEDMLHRISQAFAIVYTSKKRVYGTIFLKKGMVKNEEKLELIPDAEKDPTSADS